MSKRGVGRRTKRRQPAQPGYEGRRELVVDSVEDPYAPEKREQRARNIRHDPVQFLRARRVIGPAQYRAGCRIRALVETLGLADARSLALDALVSGGLPADIAADKIDAGRKYVAVVRAMGAESAAVVIRVAGYGEWLTEVSSAFEEQPGKRLNGNCSRRTSDHVGRLFRSGLTMAAIHFGYASARDRAAFGRRLRLWMAADGRPNIA